MKGIALVYMRWNSGVAIYISNAHTFAVEFDIATWGTAPLQYIRIMAGSASNLEKST